MAPLGSPRGEVIALREVSACKPSLNPLRALRRRTVGEIFRTHPCAGHALQPVVTHRAGGSYARLHILLLDEIALRCRICPDTSQAIRLQLQADGKGIVRGALTLLPSVPLTGYAHNLSNVLTALARQHV